jgi:hypothetical protein
MVFSQNGPERTFQTGQIIHRLPAKAMTRSFEQRQVFDLASPTISGGLTVWGIWFAPGDSSRR